MERVGPGGGGYLGHRLRPSLRRRSREEEPERCGAARVPRRRRVQALPASGSGPAGPRLLKAPASAPAPPLARRPDAPQARAVGPRPEATGSSADPGGRDSGECPEARAMAVGNINELPENILLELFTHVPARQLLLRCRLVCSLWRDLIDLVTLWKRKCLREGFITEDWDQPVADWKIFYFLRSLHRNLLHNPCAEEGFEFWSLDVNGGDEWKVEDLSRDQRKEFPNGQVKKYFVTSYYTCLKSQVVDLKAEGYWEELMDTTRPDIEVKDWFAARPDCGSKYQLCVQLLSSAHAPLGTFQPDPATIQQKSDAKWREVSHTFSNYPPGVRYIWFQHGGVDTHYWAGWYGPRVTNSSITIRPPLP
ncbi:F-box only protein 44 isoform X3 [Equus asinus]|uniref:F-box only protein 44 isoform X2 n=1 Tax=Equus przewalskii TaxID=9798 RepID=A0ABM4NPM2_EQUPR